MPKAMNKESAEALADATAAVLNALPKGVTATIVLCCSDDDDPEDYVVAMAGNTPPTLLRVVLRRALERLEERL
jgi:hypothetical protein